VAEIGSKIMASEEKDGPETPGEREENVTAFRGSGKPIKVQVGHYMAIFRANVLENK